MKNILLMSLLLAVICLDIRHRRRKEEKRNRKKIYARAGEKYLREKYNKEFEVEERLDSDYCSPIPFDQPVDWYMRANEVEEPEFTFYIYIKQYDQSNLRIKEIHDDYYWKYLYLQLREYLDEKLDEVIKAEYKYKIRKKYPEYFQDELMPTAKMEEYFKTKKILDIEMVVFVLQLKEIDIEKEERKIKSVLLELYNMSRKQIDGRLVYREVEKKEIYEQIRENIYRMPSKEWMERNTKRSFIITIEDLIKEEGEKENRNNRG